MLRLGVEGREVRAPIGGHLPPDVSQDPLGHAAPALVPGGRPGAGVEAQHLGLVVEHLLEVGDTPAGVGGVAVEPAADVVVYPAPGHRLQGVAEDATRLLVPLLGLDLPQQLQAHGGRELRGPAEAAVLAVVEGLDPLHRLGHHRGRGIARLVGLRLGPADALRQSRGHPLRLRTALGPGRTNGFQHPREPRPPGQIFGREVGAGVERLQRGREEDRVGPAAAAGEDLRRRHVHGVQVGPLLAVDLDVDEPLVHGGGDLRVGEHLALHDVAPVAGGVAHGEEDRAVLPAGEGQGLRSPGMPVDGVSGVQQQVGAGLRGQPVGGGGRGLGRAGAAGGESGREERRRGGHRTATASERSISRVVSST